MTINDYKLDQIALDYAEEIWRDVDGDIDAATDQAHEYADGSEWVIYYHKAHELCQNCNTDHGEELLDDVGPGENPTYDGLAVLIAYGELNARINHALYELAEEAEAA